MQLISGWLRRRAWAVVGFRINASPSTQRSDVALRLIERGIRMSGFSKWSLLVAVMALCGPLISSAGAGDWDTNGHRTFISTNTGAARFAVHPSMGSPVLVDCASAVGHLTLYGPTVLDTDTTGLAQLTPAFSSCAVSGVPGYGMSCSASPIDGISYGGGITTVKVTNFDCRLSFGAATCSTFTGSVHGHFINPNPIPTGTATLTLTGPGQSLTATKIGAGCAAVPNGAVTLGAPVGSGVGDITYRFHGPDAPWVIRTP